MKRPCVVHAIAGRQVRIVNIPDSVTREKPGIGRRCKGGRVLWFWKHWRVRPGNMRIINPKLLVIAIAHVDVSTQANEHKPGVSIPDTSIARRANVIVIEISPARPVRRRTPPTRSAWFENDVDIEVATAARRLPSRKDRRARIVNSQIKRKHIGHHHILSPSLTPQGRGPEQ